MKIIFITGPSGSGKTTIGKIITDSLSPCANIEVDDIKHTNMQAFAPDKQTPDGNIPYTAWDIVGQNIGLLAKNYTNNGYSVVIQGYLDPTGWQALENIINIDYKILLKPDYQANVDRDSKRPEQDVIGSQIIRTHHNHFDTEQIYKDFTIIDNSDQTLQQSINLILKNVNK
jgi:adenylate kinase family enzyme